MPLTLKTGNLKYKNTNGQYVPIGVVASGDIESAVDEWLEENITNPDSPPLDRSLSSAVSAAPADMVGALQSEINGQTKIKTATLVSPLNIILNGTSYTSSGSYNTHYVQVRKGRKYTMSISYTGSSYYFRFAFAKNIPANGVEATFLEEKNTSTKPLDYEYTATEDGYLSVSVSTSCNISSVTATGIEGGIVEDLETLEENAAETGEELNIIRENIAENASGIEGLVNLNRPDDELVLGNFIQGSMYNGAIQSNAKCITSTDVYTVMQDILIGAYISQNNTDQTVWNTRFSFFDSNGSFISQKGYSTYNGEFTSDIPTNAATFRVSISLLNGQENPDITPADYSDGRQIQMRFKYKQKYATEEAVGVIPQNLQAYDYHGEKISIRPNQIAFESYLSISGTITSINGSAVSGDYLFTAKDKMDKIAITNMRTKSAVQVMAFTAVNTYHCNNLNFGSEKYDDSDPFPILYVSMENSAEHKALGLRIQESGGVYSASVVQTITYPDNETAGMYYQNCYVDIESGYLYISGSSNSSYVAGNGNKLIFKRYAMPKLSDGNVQLTNDDVLGQFEVDLITAPQGGFITNNKLIQCYGTGSGDDQSIRICMIDMLRGVVSTNILLNNYGITTEQESMFMWDGKLFLMSVQGAVRRVYV